MSPTALLLQIRSIRPISFLQKRELIFICSAESSKGTSVLYGASVVEKLGDYHADKVLIGVVGISENGLTIPHEEDGMVKRKMIRQAEQVIALSDHSKLAVRVFINMQNCTRLICLLPIGCPIRIFATCSTGTA